MQAKVRGESCSAWWSVNTISSNQHEKYIQCWRYQKSGETGQAIPDAYLVEHSHHSNHNYLVFLCYVYVSTPVERRPTFLATLKKKKKGGQINSYMRKKIYNKGGYALELSAQRDSGSPVLGDIQGPDGALSNVV